jgi:DDE superfamily endonuclease/Transposase
MDDENRPATPPPSQRRQLSRDQRIRVQSLHNLGCSQQEIAREVQITRNQVRTAIHGPATPQHHKRGRKATLWDEEKARIIEWICSSKRNRRASWEKIAIENGMPNRMYAIRNALRQEGFSRRIARRKPPCSETTRQARLAWAQAHIDWTAEQWDSLLWTDETWTNGGRHTRAWVTRRSDETWDSTCIIERQQRRRGWMFWGSFNGSRKGPGLIWEKSWKSITSESYREHVVPLIDRSIQQARERGQHLILIQDNAPAHTARATREELDRRGIQYDKWPPFSPDLNPIEMVWNWMKEWIQNQYDDELIHLDDIRQAVQDAWDAVPEQKLRDLVDSMPARCRAVIEADGRHTQY